MNGEITKAKVFISYSHKDKEWVRGWLLHNLEDAGIQVHIDFRDFEIGKPSLLCMEEAIETCDKTILVYTKNWVNSEFTQFEAVMLQTESPLNLNKKIIPILLENCDIPKRLKILNYANFTDKAEWDSQLARVIKQIKRDIHLEPEKKTYPSLEAHHIDITRLPQTGFELFGRHKELTLLNEAWESGAANIVSFVAYGGVGKSTLVNKWVEKMRWDNYRGAKRVYGWSFYSQGTRDRVTSADKFISEALTWFGDPDPKKGSPWDKGQRLADLVRREKTLLILDGLEPLQSAHDFEKGKIKEPALSMFVTQLARNNNGLCVITTREKVPELDRFEKSTLQPNLEQISKQAGRALLRMGGVQGSDAELETASEQFGNHALAINLLASYIHGIEGHHIENAAKIDDLDIPEEKGRHPRRVIVAYEERLGEGPQIQILKILGLFDRPAELAAVEAVYAHPPIKGLTDQLQGVTKAQRNELLEELRELKLLARKSKHNPNVLDCHPLIREHFGEKLQQQNPDAWKQAHARLYEYYKNLPEKELPDTLEEMEPLFAAVMHGCLAGKHQDAMDDVFYNRIRRQNAGYDVHKLGALGADLSCLSNFFETLWDKPASSLTEADKAVTLNWAGFDLRAVGRLSEAAQPMKAAIENVIQLKDWKNAASGASTINELYLTLGDILSAQKYGSQSVTFADRSGDGFWEMCTRITHANALHQAEKNKAAEKLFIEAENMQKKRQPEYPLLYSAQGFLFCDLLLSMGKYQEVLERIRKCFEWRSPLDSLLGISLENLSFGKALMLQAVENTSSGFAEAEDYLKQAVDGLREAGTQHNLPHGLLARAILFRNKEDFLKSWTDLDEAREIAEYGQMRLHLTDYHLEACRNIKAQLSAKDYQIIDNGQTLSLTKEAMQAKFQEHFKEAERLVEKTGYHRRDGEVKELRN